MLHESFVDIAVMYLSDGDHAYTLNSFSLEWMYQMCQLLLTIDVSRFLLCIVMSVWTCRRMFANCQVAFPVSVLKRELRPVPYVSTIALRRIPSGY